MRSLNENILESVSIYLIECSTIFLPYLFEFCLGDMYITPTRR